MTDKAPRCPLCGDVFIDGTTTFTVELGFGVAKDYTSRVKRRHRRHLRRCPRGLIILGFYR